MVERDRAGSGPGPDPTETRRKRLSYRCWHRGSKEMDLLLGPFADRRVAAMTASELAEFERLLTLPDPELYNWIVLAEPVPRSRACAVLDSIIAFHNNHK